MAEPDAMRRSVAAGGTRCRARLSVSRLGLPSLPGRAGADLRYRASRPQSAHRLQRPDLAWPRRIFRHRRLWRGDPDRQARAALLARDPGRQSRLLRRGIPVRVSGAAIRRTLSRARDLRACRRDAADPHLQGFRRHHRRLAGPDADKAARALRPSSHRRPVALSRLSVLRGDPLPVGQESRFPAGSAGR